MRIGMLLSSSFCNPQRFCPTKQGRDFSRLCSVGCLVLGTTRHTAVSDKHKLDEVIVRAHALSACARHCCA